MMSSVADDIFVPTPSDRGTGKGWRCAVTSFYLGISNHHPFQAG
jgi:hypothetical protein